VYYVYILASRKHGTLYIGVTNDLVRRVYEHKTDAARGFTSRYDVHLLIWFECYAVMVPVTWILFPFEEGVTRL
jgi:putative endonuclease